MGKIYDERYAWLGYVMSDTIYKIQHNIRGYIPDPVIIDDYGRPPGYMSYGNIYIFPGMPFVSYDDPDPAFFPVLVPFFPPSL